MFYRRYIQIFNIYFWTSENKISYRKLMSISLSEKTTNAGIRILFWNFYGNLQKLILKNVRIYIYVKQKETLVWMNIKWFQK